LGRTCLFFIFGQNAFAQGIGEDLQPIELPARSYIVIQPAQNVPTLGIFQDPDLTRNTDPVKIMDFSGTMSETSGLFSQFHNDLQPVVLKRYPVVRQAFDWCASAGLAVRMTGSGACLFAEFLHNKDVNLAHQKMIGKMHFDEHSDFIKSSGAKKQCVDVPLVDVPHSVFPKFIQSVAVCDGLQEHPLRNWIES